MKLVSKLCLFYSKGTTYAVFFRGYIMAHETTSTLLIMYISNFKVWIKLISMAHSSCEDHTG